MILVAMANHPQRPYRTAAFAALAGVTTRALHHYDRLGLLKPKRSESGYRLYSEGDLAVVEEIVALKFIGVPLKTIRSIRLRHGDFGNVLHAQRTALERKRELLTRAIEAIGQAEVTLRSGAQVDAALFRHMIEVMQMDANHEDLLTKYSTMLRNKMTHLQAMSADERTHLRHAWATLTTDISAAISAGEPPEGLAGQRLLDRWLELFQAATGADAQTADEASAAAALQPAPELRDALWARRAQWMPAGPGGTAIEPDSDEQARMRAVRLSQSLAAPEVMEFIERARTSRVQTRPRA